MYEEGGIVLEPILFVINIMIYDKIRSIQQNHDLAERSYNWLLLTFYGKSRSIKNIVRGIAQNYDDRLNLKSQVQLIKT